MGDITTISEEVIIGLVALHVDSTWVIGGGPPCQDVSLLKRNRSGAFGSRSCLRDEFKRVFDTFAKHVPRERLSV